MFMKLIYTHHHLESGAGKIDQMLTDVARGPCLTPTQVSEKFMELLFLNNDI
jgi:hypothetical protein